MKAKYFIIAFLTLLLAFLVVYEEISVTNSLDVIYEKSVELQAVTIDADHINTSDVLSRVENIYDKWTEYENKLCFLINHKSIQDMATQLTYMKSYVVSDDYEDFTASLALVIHYSNIFRHLMGVSLESVF